MERRAPVASTGVAATRADGRVSPIAAAVAIVTTALAIGATIATEIATGTGIEIATATGAATGTRPEITHDNARPRRAGSAGTSGRRSSAAVGRP